jgi:hypothetical protein
MIRFSHTPGPWQADDQFITAPDPKGKHFDIYIAEIVEEDEEGRLAPKRQRRANARLISAAPAMLLALEAAEMQLSEYCMSDDGQDIDAHNSLTNIRAAIAEATEINGEE